MRYAPSINIKLLYIRRGCYKETGTIRALDQDRNESLHNPIAINPLPLRVTAAGNGGGYHDGDTVQSSFQIWDDLRPMQ
jgi:hypothetical protein